MNKVFCFLALVTLVFGSCSDDSPDVSHIEVQLEVRRFEKDFFSLDTNRILSSIQQLQSKYPRFSQDFFVNILGLPPVADTSNSILAAIAQFIRDYRPVYDSVQKLYSTFDPWERDVEKMLQRVKYYFPSYQTPQELITFIGPLDAYYETSLGLQGDVITANALATGLQLHLGASFSLYRSEMGQALYPLYISRRFVPETIPVNCARNIIDDRFPDNSASQPLVMQMIEKGKRIYVLDKLLPQTHDSLITGYTGDQLQGCYKNEGFIWNYFVTNGLVYSIDKSIIKNYVGESPSTPEFGEGSPGNIGLFVGWQIVRKYMEKNDLSLTQMMEADPKRIFEESGYRPR